MFNGPFSGTTQVSRYQKDKSNLDFTEGRDSEWQWHQLGHMQVCTSFQTGDHASTPPISFFTGWIPFLPPNQQRKSDIPASSRRQYFAFSALTLLFRCQGQHPACKNWVMRCWCGYLSAARCRLFAYDPADATASQNPFISCLI